MYVGKREGEGGEREGEGREGHHGQKAQVLEMYSG